MKLFVGRATISDQGQLLANSIGERSPTHSVLRQPYKWSG